MSAIPSNILTQQAGADPNFNPVFHLIVPLFDNLRKNSFFNTLFSRK
jgi:hypothetical protein